MSINQPWHAGLDRLSGDVAFQRAALNIVDPDWASITNKPIVFPPSAHSHLAADLPASLLYQAGNLSGLASLPTARSNLGLGSGDSPTFAGITLTGVNSIQIPNGGTIVGSGPAGFSIGDSNDYVVFGAATNYITGSTIIRGPISNDSGNVVINADVTASRIALGGFTPSTYNVPLSVLGTSVFQGAGLVNGGSVLSIFSNVVTGTLYSTFTTCGATGDLQNYSFNSISGGHNTDFRLVGIGTGDARHQYQVNGVGNPWTVGLDQSDGLKYKISNSAALGASDMLTITTAGYVGIGTADPSCPLHVLAGGNLGAVITSGSVADTELQISNSSVGGRIWTLASMGSGGFYGGLAAGTFVIRDGTAGENRLLIDPAGNTTISGTIRSNGTGTNSFAGLIAGRAFTSNTPGGGGFLQDGYGYGVLRINTTFGLCFDTYSDGYHQVLCLGTDKSATFAGTGTFGDSAYPVKLSGDSGSGAQIQFAISGTYCGLALASPDRLFPTISGQPTDNRLMLGRSDFRLKEIFVTSLAATDITASGMTINGNSTIGKSTSSAGVCYSILESNTGYVGFQQRGSASASSPGMGSILGLSEVTAYSTGGLAVFTASGGGALYLGTAGTIRQTIDTSGNASFTGNITASGTLGFTQSRFQQSALQTLQTQCYDTSLAAWQETSQQKASPTGALYSVLGSTPIAKQTHAALATDLATAITRLNQLCTHLTNFGFFN